MEREGRLQDKVAIVTGAATGQGEAIAKLFAAEGAKVVITTSRNREGLERVAGEIEAVGGQVVPVMADVTSEEDWKHVVEAAIDAFGRIDVLMNNAGINPSATIENETVEQFKHMLDIDAVGLFIGIKYVAPEMIKVGGGSIINTSSIYGPKFGSKGFSAYSTAKCGVQGLTKVAAAEYAEYGIRVNSIHPGFILTAMTVNRPKSVHEAFETKTPLKRLGMPDDIAYAAVYFASDESSFVTGAELFVDGGISFQSPIN